MTVAALRWLLAEIDTQGGPEAARQNRLDLPEPARPTGISFSAVRAWARQNGIPCPKQGRPPGAVVAAWKTSTTPTPQEGPTPVATAPAPVVAAADVRLKAAPEPPSIAVGQLLKWGDDHQDPDVRDQAARARMLLTGLRRRHAADQELTAITTEREQLEQRLAELQAREEELAPAKPKRKRGSYVRDYDVRTVRAWAAENGVDCPRVGQIPKRVLEAWRASLPQAG